MKRTILSLALLVIALASSAQTIKTNFKKGDIRKYLSTVEYTIGVPMQGEMKSSATSYTSYKVTDATNGWTVEMKVDSFTITGNNDIVKQFLGADNLEALKGLSVRLKLNPKGYITDILNADDVLAKQAQVMLATINTTYEKNPQLEKMVPKSKAIMKANEQLTKENLLKYFRDNSILNLNGKDIKPGEPEDETVMDMIKAKSTYSISKDANGLTEIHKKSVSNMTENDVKSFFIKQASNFGAGIDASQIDQIWDRLKSVGMTNMEFNNDATSTYNADGWLKTSSTNSSSSLIGAQVKVTASTTLQ